MEKMKIEIWSDIACPYCFIGKRKLEMALSQFEHQDEVELVWYSYQLDPSLPKVATDMSIYEYYANKSGITVDEAKESLQGMTDLAKQVGLNYDYDKLIVVNTANALRLVKLAAEENLATEAEEAIFSAYFEQGKNIGDKETLIELGVKIGLHWEQVELLLDSDKYFDKVAVDTMYADEQLQLEYIPFYRLNQTHVIQGSIEPEDYLQALKAAYADWKSGVSTGGDIISGQSCSIDGVCS